MKSARKGPYWSQAQRFPTLLSSDLCSIRQFLFPDLCNAALDHLMGIRDYKLTEAFVLSRNNLSQEGAITYAPLYMTFCLDELTEQNEGDFTFAPALP